MSDLGGKLQGPLIHKEAPKTGKWPAQRFTVKVTNDRGYDNYITLEANEKAMAKLGQAQIGQELIVSYNIRGNKYKDRTTGEDKYFTLLTAWAVDLNGQNAAPDAAQQSVTPQPSESNFTDFNSTVVEDDMPF